MKQLLIITGLLFYGLSLHAQDHKNYILTNYSYAFFGTGDLSGTSVGINYHRTMWAKFGLNVGVAKASGSGEGILSTYNNDNITNVTFTGNGAAFPGEIASYTTYIAGVNYKVSDGTKQTLLATVGYNYKTVNYSYIGSVFTSSEGDSDVRDYNLVSEKEGGVYAALDFMYYFSGDVSMGIHLAMENSGNIVSKAGASIGFRF